MEKEFCEGNCPQLPLVSTSPGSPLFAVEACAIYLILIHTITHLPIFYSHPPSIVSLPVRFVSSIPRRGTFISPFPLNRQRLFFLFIIPRSEETGPGMRGPAFHWFLSLRPAYIYFQRFVRLLCAHDHDQPCTVLARE